MQIGLREWLIVLGAVLIAFILFDGWRRMRRREHDRKRFNLDRRFSLNEESQSPPPKQQPLPAKPSAIIETEEEDDLPLPSLHAKDSEHHRSALLLHEMESQTSAGAAQQASTKNLADVLVIYVRAKNEKGFFGPALLQCILESGLRFGERNIFHRHESKAGNGEVLFSMANALKPGTFDLDEMEHFHIHEVVFYLPLPGPRHPKAAFHEMLAAARKLQSELEGEVKDDQHSILTAQTIEHYRRRIAEFERKKLLNR